MYIYEEYISLGPYHGVLYYTHVIYIILSEISFYIIPNPYDTLVYKQIQVTFVGVLLCTIT